MDCALCHQLQVSHEPYRIQTTIGIFNEDHPIFFSGRVGWGVGWPHWVKFLPFLLTRETTFAKSCLISRTQIPYEKGSVLKVTVNTFSEGT